MTTAETTTRVIELFDDARWDKGCEAWMDHVGEDFLLIKDVMTLIMTRRDPVTALAWVSVLFNYLKRQGFVIAV